MLSIRALARSAPRFVSRLTRSAIRRPVRQASLLQTVYKPAGSQFGAAFSTSVVRQEKEGEVDDELVSKFESEIQMEEEMRDSDEMPTSVKDFLENGPFEIQDTPGHEEVVLTRKFGDET
jgi:complement component 1 Q subcomponent-binding protein, mitochondrial